MKNVEIRRHLFEMQDKKYKAFQAALIPNIPAETVIGVRTPQLRRLAREIDPQSSFMRSLPHDYFEENQLHAFVISDMRDFEGAVNALDIFLPYVDNWATCDQISVKLFKARADELLPHVEGWLSSGETYTIRYGVNCLMKYFLDERFDAKYLSLAANIGSEEYYVKMVVAWYFATALAKQYEAALPFLENRRLDPWTHNKTIQKAVESLRISPQTKEYLRQLKCK